jgi:hypothetical protein
LDTGLEKGKRYSILYTYVIGSGKQLLMELVGDFEGENNEGDFMFNLRPITGVIVLIKKKEFLSAWRTDRNHALPVMIGRAKQVQ